MLKGPFLRLPEKKLEEVQVFEGDRAFRAHVNAQSLTVWPIAKFGSDVEPENEDSLRTALHTHAASIGADYVVIVTNPDEAKKFYQTKVGQIVFCAFAYKRVVARIGFESDKAELAKRITRVVGFLPGSHAQEAGMKVGDIVRKIEGLPPGVGELYWSKAVRWKAGDKVKVQVERDGQPLEFQVELTAS